MKIRSGFVSNSSSSSFICDTHMSPGEVEYKLRELLDFYNKMFERCFEFEEVFEEPFRDDTGIWKKEIEDYIAGSIETKGKIIINSRSDNSIPWEIVDFIENLFNGYRIHLG